jgi:hypothetical protein
VPIVINSLDYNNTDVYLIAHILNEEENFFRLEFDYTYE